MIYVGLLGKREDYDLVLARRLAMLLNLAGYRELWLADPKDAA